MSGIKRYDGKDIIIMKDNADGFSANDGCVGGVISATDEKLRVEAYEFV